MLYSALPRQYLLNYKPKTIANAVARACDTPDAAGACETHVVPLLTNTLPTVPDEVKPVPPLAGGNVPVTPVVKGRPVALVSTAADGVPRFGVVNTGDVANATTVPVPVVV
jgi:hypothetical protein